MARAGSRTSLDDELGRRSIHPTVIKAEHVTIVQQNLPVTMVREELEVIPRHILPTGYSLRAYCPGDEQLWLQVHERADLYNTFPPGLFFQEFGPARSVLEERQLYLCDVHGEAIGTATAWFDGNYKGQVYGRVHWLAIVPDEQGKGLAKALMSAVCYRLRELGHRRAYLTTSTARVPAINLYLQFGFVPEISSVRDTAVWRELRQILKYPLDFRPGGSDALDV
jgi:GNAT superfamily N-acetyltransferase